MRLYLSAGLVSGALVVSAAFALASGELDTVALGAHNDQRQPAGRLLRGGTDEGMTQEEERTNPFESAMGSTLMNAHGALHKAFTDLGLQLPKIKNGKVDVEAAKAFWSSPALREWIESSKGIVEPSEFAAYHYLMVELTPGDLAKIIHHQVTKPFMRVRIAVAGLMKKPESLSRELEKAQFRWWKHRNYSLEFLTEFLGLDKPEHPILKRYTEHVKDVMKDVWSP